MLVLLFLSLQIYCENIISGLIGGEIIPGSDPSQPYAAIVSPQGTITPVPSLPFEGLIEAVALNENSIGLIGGRIQTDVSVTNLYAAFVTSNLEVISIPLPTFSDSGFDAEIQSTALNQSNLGLIGGFLEIPFIFIHKPYAAFVSLDTLTPLEIEFPFTIGVIRQVALNQSNIGLVGGSNGGLFMNTNYAAFVFPDSSIPQAINIPFMGNGVIASVALNDLGQGIIGGSSGAYFVSTNSSMASSIDLGAGVGGISAVAINLSNVGLIGGSTQNGAAFAAFAFPNATTQIVPNLPTNGEILCSALNSNTQGLIGGFNGIGAYAAFVKVGSMPLSFPNLPVNGRTDSVAINDFDQGLIGGINFDNNLPFAALVFPSGQMVFLDLGFTGETNSVALNRFMLSQLPNTGLRGNNLIFANYINTNAPQNAIYFVPAILDGSYPQALESAAPTRNAISFNTVMQNAFYLTTNLSTHLREDRWTQRRTSSSHPMAASPKKPHELESELLASNRQERAAKQPPGCTPKPFTLWFDAMGAFASQKSQEQTPAFNPNTGALTLAFDSRVAGPVIVGGGASYLSTHIHEKKGQGKSHIHQEDLFVYASWQPNEFNLDLALWGGLFQTTQARFIHMTGFDFMSLSTPDGYQLIPHLELGWEAFVKRASSYEITWNILGMLDWANAWQNSYKEKGDSPFNIQQKSHYGSLLRTEAGLRFSETFFYQCWNLILLEKASYVNIQSLSGAGKIPATLLGSPGSFTVETLTSSQNLGAVQFGITAAPYKVWYPASTLFYQGEFGSKYQSHQLTLELAWNF